MLTLEFETEINNIVYDVFAEVEFEDNSYNDHFGMVKKENVEIVNIYIEKDGKECIFNTTDKIYNKIEDKVIDKAIEEKKYY